MYILTCYTSKRNETKQQSQKPTCCMSSTLWGHVCVPCTHFSLPWSKAPLCLTASCSALVATVHFQGAASDHMKTEIRSWSSSALNPPAAPASLRESQCPYSPQAPQAQPCRLPFRSHRPPAPTLLSSQTAPLFHTHTHASFLLRASASAVPTAWNAVPSQPPGFPALAHISPITHFLLQHAPPNPALGTPLPCMVFSSPALPTG